MKLLSIVLFVFSSSAFAEDYSQFVGKFTTDNSHCTSWTFKGTKRVYIALKKSYDHRPILELSAYGDDAAMDEILLGKGSRQAPGTSPSLHGKATQTWETYVEGNTLYSREDITRPSVGYHGYKIVTLRANAKSVTLKVETDGPPSDALGEPGDVKTCRFVR